MKRSSRDPEDLRDGLRRSLVAHVPHGCDHDIVSIEGTSATGMSSETLVFEATWTEDDTRRVERLVARVAPSEEDVPVFPSYDMAGQFATICTVATETDVPVPPPRWFEPDPSLVGSPFFVMGFVEGQVPPDVLPYNFGDSWLYHASAEDQRRLQDSTVAILARLHALDAPERRFPHLVPSEQGGTPLQKHVANRAAWYRFAARDAGRSELIERGFSWLYDHWPNPESHPVLCWGDARIGNVIYRDFEPAAVLDWEMAAIAPRESDLAWLCYMHLMFEDHAAPIGLPGMPHFLRLEDVAATYERMSGQAPRHLEWYMAYAAVQLGIVFLRTGHRQVTFGEREAPSGPDELLLNAPSLRRLTGG